MPKPVVKPRRALSPEEAKPAEEVKVEDVKVEESKAETAVEIVDSVANATPAGVAAQLAAVVASPDDQTEIAVRPPQDVIDSKKRAYSRAYKAEEWLGKLSPLLFVGTAVAVFSSYGSEYDEEWLQSRYGKATAALGFSWGITLYLKSVAKRRIRDIGRWLKKLNELESAYLNARGEDE